MTNVNWVLHAVADKVSLDDIKVACVDNLVSRGFVEGTEEFRRAYSDLVTDVLYEVAMWWKERQDV